MTPEIDGTGAIAHYRLLEHMGDGALSSTHRARDTRRGHTVALKVVQREKLPGADRDAFLADARAAATLSHPNIAILYDAGEADGSCYLAYEFAAGSTLSQETAGNAMNPRRAIELAGQVADALAAAHAHGIIHGDLRPDTVIVTSKGNAKVLELGMSRWTRGGSVRAHAAAHPDELGPEALRVVSYMSPEQALGGRIDGRTDVFSLGVMLHELLTGRNPFAAASVGDAILEILGSTVPAPSLQNAAITPDIDAIVLRALSKDIEQRPSGAAALAAELRSAGAALDVRSSDSHPALLPEFGDDEEPSRVKWWAIVVVGLVVGAAFVWWLAR